MPHQRTPRRVVVVFVGRSVGVLTKSDVVAARRQRRSVHMFVGKCAANYYLPSYSSFSGSRVLFDLRLLRLVSGGPRSLRESVKVKKRPYTSYTDDSVMSRTYWLGGM